MPSKSPYVVYLDNIQKIITPVLKEMGYKKKGRTHNRIVDEGIVHVINFQSGEFPIGDKYVIPGIRESAYGTFTVNVGVFIKEIHELKESWPIPDFIPEHICQVRARLSNLTKSKKDWWPLNEDYKNVADEIIYTLKNEVTAWFNNFLERGQIIKSLQNNKIYNLLILTGKLNAAIIQIKSDRAAGINLLKEHYKLSYKHKPHQEYVKELALKMGVPGEEFNNL